MTVTVNVIVANISNAIMVHIFLFRIGYKRAIVVTGQNSIPILVLTRIACSVLIRIQLVGIVSSRAVVGFVDYAITVAVVVTHIAEAIMVGVALNAGASMAHGAIAMQALE